MSAELDDLPGGVSASRCFDVVEWPDEGIWLWLGDAAVVLALFSVAVGLAARRLVELVE
jgi:hypothetical protein